MELFEALLFMIVTSFYGPSLLSLSSVLDTDNSELLRACGTKMPDKVTSSGNKMTVMFKTDGSVDRRGFKATWKQVASKPEPECRHELHEEVNIYDKEDLKWTWAVDMKTWQDCAVLCERRRGCSYWTYYRSGYYSGYCGTMINIGGVTGTEDRDTVSGIMRCR